VCWGELKKINNLTKCKKNPGILLKKMEIVLKFARPLLAQLFLERAQQKEKNTEKKQRGNSETRGCWKWSADRAVVFCFNGSLTKWSEFQFSFNACSESWPPFT